MQPATSPMPAMEAVVKVLESEGVDTVFGIPGAAILPFYKALLGSSIAHVVMRHEEGATHAADPRAPPAGSASPPGPLALPEPTW